MAKTLIAYYSRADENYVSGALKTIPVGNTEIVAEYIKELTGADMFKIEQAKPYSENYNSCVEEAKADQTRNARPELKKYLDSVGDYDVEIAKADSSLIDERSGFEKGVDEVKKTFGEKIVKVED